jgi:cytochrome c553
VTDVDWQFWRPPVLALVAVLFGAGCLPAQGMTLEERLQQCAACHGEDGNSRTENVPSIAGQPEFFVLNQLFLMREGVRKVEAMAEVVKDLTDEDLSALAAHFARLPALPSGESIEPALVRRGAEIAKARRCESCHGADLAGREQVPRIAKQRLDFLLLTLKEFRDQPRAGADTLMSSAVAGLSDDELAALAHYAASR